jgi:hypothetical protein
MCSPACAPDQCCIGGGTGAPGCYSPGVSCSVDCYLPSHRACCNTQLGCGIGEVCTMVGANAACLCPIVSNGMGGTVQTLPCGG